MEAYKKNSIRLKRLIMMIIRVEHISLFYFQPFSLSLPYSTLTPHSHSLGGVYMCVHLYLELLKDL